MMKIIKDYIAIFLIGIICGQGWAQTKEKTFNISKKYINIPIDQKQPRQLVNFKVNGKVYTYNDIRVAKDHIDYWTFIDVEKFNGSEFTLEFSQEVSGIDRVYQSDEFDGQKDLYKEKLRPQVHFTTRRGWTNDPNGMVYYDGEYHLFYQHNPYEVNWGNMTWGHAVSKDLIHWEELPIALVPDELGTMFSGSAVIDKNNTSGFKQGNKAPLVAIYTAHLTGKKQQQCVAYSLDNGRTFTKYEGNPVLPATKPSGSGHERDPKVFWYEPGQHWVMILHEALNFGIYNSNNLKDWKYQSSIDSGFWECPELFQMAVDGDLNNKKWVMYGVQGTYLIGDFDGQKFIPESDLLRYNVGGMTAAQTFNDEPKGRRLQIGWGHAEFPEMPFKQTFTVVQEFNLKSTKSGIRLFVKPAEEIKKLYLKSNLFKNEFIGDELNNKLASVKSPLLHIKADIEIDNCRVFGLNINEYKIEYDVSANTLNGHFLPLKDRQLGLEVVVDKNLIEVYANGGLLYWFENYNDGNLDNFNISFFQKEDALNSEPKTLVKVLEVNELKSIWNQ